MEAKRAADSAVTISQLLMPQDANVAGNVHGGVIMKHIDNAAGVVAARHARCNVVTASIDRLDFHYPAFIGDLLTLKASINLVGRTSMEIGVRVETENLRTGEHFGESGGCYRRGGLRGGRDVPCVPGSRQVAG